MIFFNSKITQTILVYFFLHSYTDLLKAGIVLISATKNLKVRTLPGHHIKILELISKILNDNFIFELGNAMRMKRNTDLYGGRILITEKESKDYYNYVEKVIDRIKKLLRRK